MSVWPRLLTSTLAHGLCFVQQALLLPNKFCKDYFACTAACTCASLNLSYLCLAHSQPLIVSQEEQCNLCLFCNQLLVVVLQAQSSVQMGTLLPRERQRHEYQQALVDRYKHLPQVKRITRHRHLPTPIYKVSLSCNRGCVMQE